MKNTLCIRENLKTIKRTNQTVTLGPVLGERYGLDPETKVEQLVVSLELLDGEFRKHISFSEMRHTFLRIPIGKKKFIGEYHFSGKLTSDNSRSVGFVKLNFFIKNAQGGIIDGWDIKFQVNCDTDRIHHWEHNFDPQRYDLFADVEVEAFGKMVKCKSK